MNALPSKLFSSCIVAWGEGLCEEAQTSRNRWEVLSLRVRATWPYPYARAILRGTDEFDAGRFQRRLNVLQDNGTTRRDAIGRLQSLNGLHPNVCPRGENLS
jgi:hypothetical protein